ncbi:MAG: HutD family protein [Negativicutes bacterium]|nr:HutD family protein [Negativicutes bacterium]
MQVFHQTAKDYTTLPWSGGSTTQLFLWPPKGSYPERDFLFRISSATVETETSSFTELPGIDRWITPLQGSLTLRHEGHHSVTLQPLQIDSFSGSWQTTCIGKARDFNLMLKKCQGQMELLPRRKRLEIEPTRREAFEGFYFTKPGNCLVQGTVYAVQAGDLLLLHLQAEEERVEVILQMEETLHLAIQL